MKQGRKPVFSLFVSILIFTVLLGLISIRPSASSGSTYHPGSGLINSYPGAYVTNGTVSNPTYAFDKNNATAANYNAGANPYPGYSYFNTSAFNASVYEDYLFRTVDFKMKYDFASAAKSYPSSSSSGIDQVDSRPTASGTNGSVTNPTYAYDNNQLTAAVFDVTSASATHFEVKTFPTYPAYTVLGVNIKMNYSAVLHDGAGYLISLYVLTKSIVLQYWVTSNKTAGAVGWLGVPEPNDGTWTWTDISNARIRIEARKEDATHGSGSIYEYEGWLSVIAPGGPVTNPASAYDGNLATAATINIGSNWYPGLSFFTVATFNNTVLGSYVTSSIDIKMKYAVTLTNAEYRILLTVKTRSRVLQEWEDTGKPASIEHWMAIPEPNDGIWNATDIGNIELRVETRKTASGGTGTFSEYESWALPGGAEYRVVLTVASSSAVLQDWAASDYSDVRVWIDRPEPNDAIWNWTDVRNIRISVQTRRTASWGAGTFSLYEAWASMQADTNLYMDTYPSTGSGVVIDEAIRPGVFPTSGGFSSQFNSRPTNYATNGSVTNPTWAYDRINSTAAVYTKVAGDPLTPTYFELKSFNDTFTSYQVTKINIYMNYSVTLSSAQYAIEMYVGSVFYKTLQIYTISPRTPPSVRQWLGQAAPDDGVWNSTDIQNIRIVIRLKKTAAGGTATFSCYENWVALPKDRIVMTVSIANVANLYSYGLRVSWSTSIFNATNVFEGPFLKQGGATSFISTVDNVGGFVTVGSALQSMTSGVSGSGALVIIELQVKSYGSTLLHLHNSGLETRLVKISHWLVDGYFNNKIPGDVNSDKTVNTSDLTAMKNAYGTTQGDTSWNPECDFDWNTKADVKDLYKQGRNYGRSTP